eukprot:scaffold70862_cov30-Attheya_sp.AAC.1
MKRIHRNILWTIKQFKQYQQNDPRLQAAHERLPNKFPRIQVTNGVELIVYQREPNIPWRIAVPDAMLD